MTRHRRAVEPLVPPDLFGATATLDVLFTWAARDGGRGKGGVTDDGARATALLLSAMLTLPPGAVGEVRAVRYDHENPLDYVPAEPVIQAHRTPGGSVLFTGGREMRLQPSEAAGFGAYLIKLGRLADV